MNNQENIYVFPKSRIIREPKEPVPEEIQAMKSKSLQKHAALICDEIFDNICADFEDVGLDNTNEHFNKDAYFLFSVLSSLVYRNMGLDHELHTFVDENVKVIDKEEADAEVEKVRQATEAYEADEAYAEAEADVQE